MSQSARRSPISSTLINKVLFQAQTTASHSWEYGVVFEALLEYHNPSLTVFCTPVSEHQKHLSDLEYRVNALDYVKPFIRTESITLCEGNGSSADPASLGIPALLLDLTNPDAAYLSAAQRQIEHLLVTVPRLPNGAISHREATASAWADFTYMVPPFFAYYGVYKDDERMVREAVQQCRLYREVLGTKRGPWKHIVSTVDSATGERKGDDNGLWSTSNGWAAAGMARTLAALRSSRFAEQMREEQNLLVEMINSILCGAMKFDTDVSGLLRNYLDEETWWGEVSGTALMAATVFRMAVLEPRIFGAEYSDWALRKMCIVGQCIDADTGIIVPVVNPLQESQKTAMNGVSPEGQAFVVLMYVAWQDWVRDDVSSRHD